MSANEFNTILEQLNREQAQRFDPVRFAYLQGLARRIEMSANAQNSVLIDKALTAAKEYLVKFKSKQVEAENVLSQLETDQPEQFDRAQSLFEHCQFGQLASLQSAPKQKALGLSLSDLSQNLNQSNSEAKMVEGELSFEELLKRQQQGVMAKSEPHSSGADIELPDSADSHAAVNELKSMKAFRESMRYFNIDRIIDRAINDEPANPGPHNPHMLAIKSLTKMQTLSPQYLRRFASYIETLLWLEKNAAKLSDGK